jgi:uncharacterized protein (UPF0210 family)
MKIRTITTGISFKSPADFEKIEPAARFNQKAKEFFEQQGYEVQTARLATNSWEQYLTDSTDEETLSQILRIEEICRDSGTNLFSIGFASLPDKIRLCPEIIKSTSLAHCSVKIGDAEAGISPESVRTCAEVIRRIADETKDGMGNFRFCGWANCKPGIPFFPAAYHEGETSFSIGLECSDLLVKAFSVSENLFEAEQNFKTIVEEELKRIEDAAQRISIEYQTRFRGIDASLAPSLVKEESIAFAYEKFLSGKFGAPGTLAISAVITRVLKNLSVKTCGYSGLMLPVCEDFGLAQRAGERTYNLVNLLLYSAVCGCGLDVVPLPGDITVEKIEGILSEVATLAITLDKPLSARLLPSPGKKAGDMTDFDSPYLVNCRVFDIG